MGTSLSLRSGYGSGEEFFFRRNSEVSFVIIFVGLMAVGNMVWERRSLFSDLGRVRVLAKGTIPSRDTVFLLISNNNNQRNSDGKHSRNRSACL